jgi:uncharacterized protein (DUF4415 family)
MAMNNYETVRLQHLTSAQRKEYDELEEVLDQEVEKISTKNGGEASTFANEVYKRVGKDDQKRINELMRNYQRDQHDLMTRFYREWQAEQAKQAKGAKVDQPVGSPGGPPNQ